MKRPSISISQAVEHGACETGLVNFIKNFLPNYNFDKYIDGDINDEDLLYDISSLVDVDAPRELQTLEQNTVPELIWALRRIGLPDETVNLVCRKAAIFAAESVLHIFERKHPADKRPRKAIEVAKAYLIGDISRDKPREARDAAAAAAAAAADAAAYAACAAADAYAAADADAAADAIKIDIRNYFNSLLMDIGQ